jgi:hypothetical protein
MHPRDRMAQMMMGGVSVAPPGEGVGPEEEPADAYSKPSQLSPNAAAQSFGPNYLASPQMMPGMEVEQHRQAQRGLDMAPAFPDMFGQQQEARKNDRHYMSQQMFGR